MPRFTSACLIVLTFICLLGPTGAPAQVNPPPISWRYQGYVETSEWWLEHETLPGWNYLVEESQDLATWAPMAGGFTYGDGGLKRHFITHASVPMESGESPPPPTEAVSKEFRVIQWEVTLSADPNSSTIHLKRLPMPGFPAWDTVMDLPLPRLVAPETSRRCYFLSYEDESHDIWCEPSVKMPTASQPQPADSLPSGGAQEEFELAVFQSTVNQLTAYLSYPLAPAQPDNTPRPHKFVRIRRSAADSNHNGIPDWQEMQYGFPVFTAGIDPNGDEDGDGRTNAQEFADGTDPRTADPAAVILNSSYSVVTVHQCQVQGAANPTKEETASNGLYNYTGASPGTINGSVLDSAIGEVWSRAGSAASLNHYADEDRPSAILNAFAWGRYHSGASGARSLTSSYGSSFSNITDGGGMKYNLKLSSNRPPSLAVQRHFLPIRRIQSESQPLETLGPITNWNHTLSAIVTHTLSPSSSTAPVESSPVSTLQRPAINNVADGHQIRSEWTYAEISLRADTSRNGIIGPEDYHTHQPAVYAVNYSHDEARSDSANNPTEDAVKWTASDDSPARHTNGEPLRKLRPVDENWEVKVTAVNAEKTADLAPLRIAPIAFGTPALKVFLTLPVGQESKVKAFHLYLVKTAANGTKSYQPIWGGCNVEGTATTVAAAPLATASAPIKFDREVDITKFINPSATGYIDSRPAPIPGNTQPLYEFALEGILFRGMPYPEADGYARYGPSTSPSPVFDGILKIGLEFRDGAGTTYATTTAITGAQSWATLTCAPSIPLDATGNPQPAPIADLIAFKGITPETTAQGYGRNAIGGRYGHLFTVTHNGDSALDENDPSSLRYAINSPVPRTIIFAMDGVDATPGDGGGPGTITLRKPLDIKDRQCTIAGQTAFRNGSDGICLKHHGLRIMADDVMVRYLRSRPGNDDQPVDGEGGNTDCFTIEGTASNVLFDHCSASFSSDCLLDVITGTLSGGDPRATRPNRRITAQNCLFAWPLDYANHWEKGVRKEHGFATLVWMGHGAGLTLWRNFYGHIRSRIPRARPTYRTGLDSAGLQFDLVNNVIYGWGDKVFENVAEAAGYDDSEAAGDSYGKYNLQSNSYRTRVPRPLGDKRAFRIQNLDAKGWLNSNRSFSNLERDYSAQHLDQYGANFVRYEPFKISDGVYRATPTYLTFGVGSAFPTGIFAVPLIPSADLAQESVVTSAGASVRRDALDARLLGRGGSAGEYQARSGTIIDSPAQVGGWPVLKVSETVIRDADGDGIPDEREPHTPNRTPAWKNDPRNAALDDDRDGYTNLEEYLATLANP